MEYPKWLYKAGEEAKVVNDKTEEDALGSGWSTKPDGKPDAPAKAPAVAPAAKPAPDKSKS